LEFSWDEPKRESVLAERGIDFLRVAFSLFDGRSLLTVPTPRAKKTGKKSDTVRYTDEQRL
jgi:uncharacterized DUF497 family protein